MEIRYAWANICNCKFSGNCGIMEIVSNHFNAVQKITDMYASRHATIHMQSKTRRNTKNNLVFRLQKRGK